MDCKVTAFDRILNITEKLPEDDINKAASIIENEKFNDFLDFCVKKRLLY